MKNQKLFIRTSTLFLAIGFFFSFVGCKNLNAQDCFSVSDVADNTIVEYISEETVISSEDVIEETPTTTSPAPPQAPPTAECTHQNARCLWFDDGQYECNDYTDRYAILCACGYKDIIELPYQTPLTIDVKKIECAWKPVSTCCCPDDNLKKHEIRKPGTDYNGKPIEKIFFILTCNCGYFHAYYHDRHALTSWETITPATLTEEGLAYRHCVDCDFEETTIIEKLREEDIGKTDEEIFWDHLFDGIDLSDWDGKCSCCGLISGDGYNGTCKYGGIEFFIDDSGDDVKVLKKHVCIHYLENGEVERIEYLSTDDKDVYIRLTP